MSDDRTDEMVARLRENYNVPPPTPREEMWAVIQARLEPRKGMVGSAAQDESTDGTLLSLDAARRRRAFPMRPLSWAAAAAALLVLGVGIGRMTAPVPTLEPVAVTGAGGTALRTASVEHLLRTESLLTLVRADARAGRMEPQVGRWARGLLSETRMLMDAQGESDPAMKDLLEDLELVLVQIVGVTNAGDGDEARVRSELTLALNGMEEREVLPRIQAVVPAGTGMRGT